MIVFQVNGQGPRTTVAIPGPEVGVRMANVVGRRVEFAEDLLSCSFANPTGWSTGIPRLRDLIGKEPAAQVQRGKVFELWGAMTTRGDQPVDAPVLHLYALLAESGPVRVAVPLVPWTSRDQVLRHAAANRNGRGTGEVRVTVRDQRGVALPLRLRWTLAGGRHLYENRAGDGALAPEDVKWGGKLVAGEPTRVPCGQLTVDTLAPFLHHRFGKVVFDVMPGQVAEMSHVVPWVLSNVDITASADEWWLQLDGSSIDGVKDTRSYVCDERTMRVVLPTGEYRLLATKVGFHKVEKFFSVNDVDQVVALDAFEWKQLK